LAVDGKLVTIDVFGSGSAHLLLEQMNQVAEVAAFD